MTNFLFQSIQLNKEIELCFNFKLKLFVILLVYW